MDTKIRNAVWEKQTLSAKKNSMTYTIMGKWKIKKLLGSKKNSLGNRLVIGFSCYLACPLPRLLICIETGRVGDKCSRKGRTKTQRVPARSLAQLLDYVGNTCSIGC